MDFLYGTIETDIPPEFVPPEVWPEYGNIASPPPFCRREQVEGYTGLRWSCWPLCFEQHIRDTEPDLKTSKQGKLAYNRLVMWHRIRSTDIPKGWRSGKNSHKVDGFNKFNDDVTTGWHKNARRDLRVWKEHHENITHSIERILLDEFDAAYRQSSIAKRVDLERLRQLKRRIMLPEVAPHLELWGVRDLATKKIIAGTAIIFSPTSKGSTHFAPFILNEGRSVFAATALIYTWFTRAKERGCIFAVTTNFWIPGKPKSWKGFSEFKSHFGWKYIAYPPELFRFVPGKLW